MKIQKIIAIAVLLIATPLCVAPCCMAADRLQVAAEDFPMFDNDLAAKLWGMWRHDPSTLTQSEYGQILELCNVAFDYLNAGYQEIIDRYQSPDERKRHAADFSDIGKSGNMVTFARSFSNRMQNLASQGKFSEENMIKVRHMILKKREFKRLLDIIHQ